MINVIVLSIFIGVNLGQFKRGICGNYPTWDCEKDYSLVWFLGYMGWFGYKIGDIVRRLF